MTRPTSRHDGAPTYLVPVDGQRVELLEPRTPPVATGVLTHTVVASDRLDLIAARYFATPFEYWRIADANDGLVPEDVLEPGRAIAIPKRT